MTNTTNTEPLHIVFGTTVGFSAFTLLKGQLRHLRGKGWRVTLACTPDDYASATAAREGATLEPIPMEREISPVADLRALFAWIKLLRRLRPDATNVGTPKAGLLGGIAAWLTRVPRRVYTLHGLRLEGATGLKAKVLWLMEWVSLHCATEVLVVSRSLGEELRRRRLLRRGRALIIGEGGCNGVAGEEISRRVAAMDKVALRSALGFEESDIVVGYVGRIAADKGLDVLLAAMRLLPDSPRTRLLLVGGVEDEQIAPLIETAGEQCVSVGWQEDVIPFYATMDMLCLPTRREGLPTVVLEASAAGLPTVSTMATGARDAVVDGVTGILVQVDDVDGLAEAIAVLASDPVRRKILGDAAQRRALEDFRPEAIWRGIDSVLRGEVSEHVVRI